MSRVHVPIQSFNAGEVSRSALARVDLSKMRMAMEVEENFLPRVIGPALFRPGLEYMGATRENLPARLIPFVFDTQTTAVLELTSGRLRPRVNGQPIVRPAVTPRLQNGDWTSGLSGWTDVSEAGASAEAPGGLNLRGTGFNEAGLYQRFGVAQPGTEHALRIRVTRGPVILLVGATQNAGDIIGRTALRTGEHSIAFTPGSGFVYVEFRSADEARRSISFCQIEPAETVEIATPFDSATSRAVRFVQSGDVLFCASGRQQQRIERRSQRSWSVVDYAVSDGPFRPRNLGSVRLSFDAAFGEAVMTASAPIFTPSQVGALFRVTMPGQAKSALLAGSEQWTDGVRITGLKNSSARAVQIKVEAVPGKPAFSGTLTLQRSVGEIGGWEDVPDAPPADPEDKSIPKPTGDRTYTAPGAYTYNDDLDNEIIFYRVGFKQDGYTSGVARVTVSTKLGVQDSIVRATSHLGQTQLKVDVLQTLSGGGVGVWGPTRDWQEGAWSDRRGYPTAVTIHDGRLVWGQNDQLFFSVSDAYESFDDTKEGDAGPIVRSVATGGFEGVLWLLSLQRLLAGTASQEISIRSSSFDEPLTPTAFTARDCSTRGSAPIQAVRVDTAGIFVQRNRAEVLALLYDVQSADYGTQVISRLNPEMCAAGVVDIAVQRQPDTRVWFVLGDGTCAVLTYERADEVAAWTKVVSPGADGRIEAVCVLPRADEDEVWFSVRRTVAGANCRFVERLAMERDARGGTLNRVADAHVARTLGNPAAIVTGLGHLEGQSVVAWGDGKAMPGTYLVTGGQIAMARAAASAVVGLPYTGRLRTTKLAYGGGDGTALAKPKRVDSLALLLSDVSWKGVRIGRDFDRLAGLSNTLRGRPLADGEVVRDYETAPQAFGGAWDVDSRVCLTVEAPHSCEAIGLVIGMVTNDGAMPRQAGDAE